MALGLLLDAARSGGLSIDSTGIGRLSDATMTPGESVEEPISSALKSLRKFGHSEISWAGALGLLSDKTWEHVGAMQSLQGGAEAVPRHWLGRWRPQEYRPTRAAREAEIQKISTLLSDPHRIDAEYRDILLAMSATGASDHALSFGILARRGSANEVIRSMGTGDVALAHDISKQLTLAYKGWLPGGVTTIDPY